MSNEIHRCLNCNYLLVLLERRRKFKCAKCGRLFLQKSIEDKSFRRWNAKQRELDEHNLKLEKRELKQRTKLSPEERELKAKESNKKWRLNNKEKCRELSEKSYYKNRNKILSNKKIYRQLSKDKNNNWRKEYRKKNVDKTRILGRIHYFRRQQSKLALNYLKQGISAIRFPLLVFRNNCITVVHKVEKWELNELKCYYKPSLA